MESIRDLAVVIKCRCFCLLYITGYSLSPHLISAMCFLMRESSRFYSGAVAAAREALISGVPSLSISLNW